MPHVDQIRPHLLGAGRGAVEVGDGCGVAGLVPHVLRHHADHAQLVGEHPLLVVGAVEVEREVPVVDGFERRPDVRGLARAVAGPRLLVLPDQVEPELDVPCGDRLTVAPVPVAEGDGDALVVRGELRVRRQRVVLVPADLAAGAVVGDQGLPQHLGYGGVVRVEVPRCPDRHDPVRGEVRREGVVDLVLGAGGGGHAARAAAEQHAHGRACADDERPASAWRCASSGHVSPPGEWPGGS